METDYTVVFVTASSRLEAEKIAQVLVEEKLAAFQPKNRQKLEATFNKTDGSLSSFEFVVDEWLMMKGGETQKYFFKKQ